MAKTFELIVCIVNQGFSDAAMDYAREAGAGGGTIIKALGTANPEAEKLFDITVDPQKEVLFIISQKEKTDNILTTLYEKVGLNTAGAGIAFVMPVDQVVGLPAKQLQ